MLEFRLVSEGEIVAPEEVVDLVVIDAAFEGSVSEKDFSVGIDFVGELEGEVEGSSLRCGEAVEIEDEGVRAGEVFFSVDVEEGDEAGVLFTFGHAVLMEPDFCIADFEGEADSPVRVRALLETVSVGEAVGVELEKASGGVGGVEGGGAESCRLGEGSGAARFERRVEDAPAGA